MEATAPPVTDATVAAPPAAGRPQTLHKLLAHLNPSTWAYFDLLVIAAGTFFSYRLFFANNPDYRWIVGPAPSILAFCTSIILAGLVFGLYERATFSSRSRILVRGGASLLVGLVIAHAVMFIFFYANTTRWLPLGVAVCYAAVALPARVAAFHVLSRTRQSVLFLGCGAAVQRLIHWLETDPRNLYNVLGFLEPTTANIPHAADCERAPALRNEHDIAQSASNPTAAACRRLGPLADLPAVFATHTIDTVVVDTELVSAREAGAAVLACLDQNVRVIDQSTFIEKYLSQVPAETITPHWFLQADLQAAGGFEAIKRLTDVAAATFGLLLTLPLWPLLILAIRLESPGPALFKQARVGLHGRIFTMLKFRTMRNDAERDGPVWAAKGDARVTRLGHWLRRSRLDEIPQLWNILVGEMSLVGPRPERPEFVRQLAAALPHYPQRHLVRPGLTGWAQIHYGYGANLTDAYRKLCYDLYYLKHRSLDLDAAIIIRTAGRVFCGSR